MRKTLLRLYRELKTLYLMFCATPNRQSSVDNWKRETWKLETKDGKLAWPAESPYEVAVGAVLTQNTNWKNAEKAIMNLKKAGLLSESKILETPNNKLETLIRSSGFYRQKAERLKAMTKTWLKILDMKNTKPEAGNRKPRLDEMRNLLLATHGIGKETADSILLYALNKPIFVIDAYTRKFCKRMLNKEFAEYDECRLFFENNLPRDVSLYKDYHALIVEWAKAEKQKQRKSSS